ncbi:MAG: hypothetical protein LBJ12_06610 [Oscillospiraceae bacterium]|jgi:hypothetical protein|nr:hypothetical protein [Oscillospiraceae bacterium]
MDNNVSAVSPRRNSGIWEKIFKPVIDNPDFEWLMTDASHGKVHPRADGAAEGNQDMERTKGDSAPKYT